MNLKGSIDRKYKLELQTLTEKPVGEIRFYEGLNYAPSISDIGKVSFTIYDTIMDNGVPIKNEIYSQIKSEMLLVIDGYEYYYINSAKEKADNGIILEKEIVAYSREYELVKRRISKYSAESRFLYYIEPDGENGFPYNENTYPGAYVFETIDEDGLYTGIFNEIENMTTWRLERDSATGYPKIPNTISKKARGLEFMDNSLLDILNRLQEVYECHFSFDTKNKIIKVNRFEDLTIHSGIMISDKNFINELEQNIVTEEIRTRMHIQDKDGRGIGDKMPHGGSYVENYEYFYDEMSGNLQNALSHYISENNAYQSNTSLLWEEYDKLLIELDESYIVLSKKKKEVLPYNETIVVLTEIRDGKTLADGTEIAGRSLTPEEEFELSQAVSAAKRLNAEIQEMETEYKPTFPRSLPTISAELDRALKELREFAGKFNMKSMFEEYENTHGLPSGSLYNEMDIYIRDEFISLEYSASVAEIFDEALEIANNLGKPRVQIEIDAENFTKMIDYEDLQDMWKIGTTIDVKHSKMDVIGQIVLLSYEHETESNAMKLQFSNKTDFVTGGSILAKNMAKTGYSASKVDIGSSAWNKGGYSYKDDASFMAVHLNAVERATELLTGIVTEGYVIMRPNEILIMDNENPDLAEKVWRWNLNGLGYSATGINGNYGLAMTMDGQIVADFISTGTLNASKIGVTNLSASSINTGTLNANDISVINLSASSINTGTMSASYIYGGTINGDNVNVTNLDASNINTGTLNANNVSIINLSASNITTGTLNGNYVNITNLDAGNINTGTLSANRIYGGSITGSSISLGNFSVNTSGYMYASSGTIGGWTITDTRLYNGRSAGSSYYCSIDPTTTSGNVIRIDDSSGSRLFSVHHNGTVYVRGADIEGEVRASSGSFRGSITATSGTFSGSRVSIGGADITSYGSNGLTLGDYFYIGPENISRRTLIPNTNGTHSLGASGAYWRRLYASNIYGTVNDSSDIRLKSEIQDIMPDILEVANNITTKSFYVNREKDKLRFGYLAQDVEREFFKYATKQWGIEEARRYVENLRILGKDGESYMTLVYQDLMILKIASLEQKVKDLQEVLNG